MKIHSVLTSIFLTLFSLQSLAGTVEVAQWMPWSSLVQEAKNWPVNFQSTAQNFTLQWQEWKPQALQTEFSVQGGVPAYQITKNGIQMVVGGLTGSLKAGGLSLDQTVVKEIGGNQIQIHIKVSCQPFEIHIPSFDLAATAPFQRQGGIWQPVLSDLKLAIHEGWSVGSIICEGPMGIEDRITALIQDSLKNPDSLATLLKNYISPELQKKWQDSWQQLTMQNYKELKVNSMSDPMDEGFFLKGEITAGKGNWKIALPTEMSVMSKVTGPQLVISSEGFAALAKETISQFSIQKYDLQQIPAFKKLMHSRLAQLFAWSDLLHFGRNTPFWLSTKPDQKVDVQSLGGGRWQVQVQTLGVIEVERKGQLRNYINWGIGLSSVSTTDVKDSQLLLQSGTPKSNLNWSFDPQYVKDFHPGSISQKVLKAATESLFQSRSSTVQLPTVTIKDRTWKLNGWTEDRGLIWMEWK
jgi:hypothetical protein